MASDDVTPTAEEREVANAIISRHLFAEVADGPIIDQGIVEDIAQTLARLRAERDEWRQRAEHAERLWGDASAEAFDFFGVRAERTRRLQERAEAAERDLAYEREQRVADAAMCEQLRGEKAAAEQARDVAQVALHGLVAGREQLLAQLHGMQDGALLRDTLARCARLEAALRPFALFADQWDRHPITGLDVTRLYCIHTGKDEGVFSLVDCRRAREALGR